MDTKTPAEGSVRKRRSNTAARQQQQREWELKREREWTGALPTAASRSRAREEQSQSRASSMTVAVVPPSGHCHKSVTKRHSRCTGGRDQVLVTSRVAFGSTCGATTGSSLTLMPATIKGRRSKLDTGMSSRRRSRPQPMVAAHEQLEQLLTRIEREAVVPGSPAMQRRRKPVPAKSVRRQMEHPPPGPTVTPSSSARRRVTSPNPAQQQQVPRGEHSSRLDALLNKKQPEKKFIGMMGDTYDNTKGDPSRDTIRQTLEMLPLALTPGESPYAESFWAGHRYLKERQQLHQLLQPDDVRYKDVKILRHPNGKLYLSKTLEEELKDEKHALDFIESELQRHQEETVHEEQRALLDPQELERQKYDSCGWRTSTFIGQMDQAEMQETVRITEKKLKLKRQELSESLRKTGANEPEWLKNIEKGLPIFQQKQRRTQDFKVTPRPHPPRVVHNKASAGKHNKYSLGAALKQRQQFQEQCQRSSFYNTSGCTKPWSLYANISTNLGTELVDSLDDQSHDSYSNYYMEDKAVKSKRTH